MFYEDKEQKDTEENKMIEGEEIVFEIDGLKHTAIIDHVSYLKHQYCLQIRITKSEDLE